MPGVLLSWALISVTAGWYVLNVLGQYFQALACSSNGTSSNS